MKHVQIRFLSGSRKELICPIEKGKALSIGRSRSNTIVLTEPDVSARHCILRKEAGTEDNVVLLEVLSSRITKLEDTPLCIGDKKNLTNGQRITMGDDVVFRFEEVESDVEESDDIPTLSNLPADSPKNDPEKTIPPVPESSPAVPLPDSGGTNNTTSVPNDTGSAQPDENFETQAIRTRIASADEIEEIKKSFQNRQRKKGFLIASAVTLFLVLTLGCYFYFRPETETQVSWPADLKDPKATTALVLRSNVGIVFPSTVGYSTKKDQIEVFSALGKNREIPLHILAKSWDDPASLELDRDAAFRKCVSMLQEKDNSLNVDSNRERIFVNTGLKDSAGVPLNFVSYTRRVENDDVFGYLIFFRYHQEQYIALMEVPVSTQWKTSFYLKSQIPNMFRISNAITPGYWEGCSNYRKKSSIRDDLEEARIALMQRSPASWSRIFLCVRSALIKAQKQKRPPELEQAKRLLLKLRQLQAEWYSAQKLAYLYAENNQGKHTREIIQSNCESAFTAEFQNSDYRYDLIRRKVWK